ncbi:MAG: isopeptide-forming domain-containing fimbrial protein, partial [Clostridium sp.]|nr:isopeptide-forming domain-containing fimbrial protein [Clostridium sp.]
MGLNLMVVQNGLELNDVKCELYLSVDGEPGTDPLGDGLEIPVVNKDSDLFLLIQKKNMERIGAGIEYVVNLQNSKLKAPDSDGEEPLMVNINEKEIQYGTLSWEAGGTELTLEFMDFEEPVEGGKITLQDLTDIRIWFGCNLDVEMDDVDARGQFNIRLPGGKTFDIAVEEWVPKPPQLEKSDGVIDESTGLVNWTVTYTHPVASYVYMGDKPARIADVMPDGMEYVSGSGKVIVDPPGGGSELELSYVTPAPGEQGKPTLYWTVPGDLAGGAKVTIEYSTRITNEQMGIMWASTGDAPFIFSNKAEAQSETGYPIVPYVEAESKVEIPKDWGGRLPMVGKVGAFDPDGTGALVIEWTVTVHTDSRNFKNLYIQDTMGKGLAYKEGSIQVTGDGVDFTTDELANALQEESTGLKIHLVKDAAPSVAAKTYIIKYRTDVNVDYFEQTGNTQWQAADVSNSATIHYEWPDGEGPGDPPTPPTIQVGPGTMNIDNALIKKEAVGNYDRINHKMTWKITVNPNNVDLTTAKLVEDIDSVGGLSHTFAPPDVASPSEAVRSEVEDALKKGLDAARLDKVNCKVTVENEKKIAIELTVDTGNGGTKIGAFSFNLTTYADDPAFWAGNAEGIFKNEVVMKKEGTTVSSQAIFSDMKASAEIKAKSNVLRKSHTGYDPNTKKIQWQLVVNENEMNLGDVVIEDQLPSGLSCTPEDIAAAEIDNTSFNGGDNKFAVTGDGKITITLKTVTAKQTITFPTTVDTDGTAFREKAQVTFTNSARLQSYINSQWSNTGEVSAVIGNKALDKTAVTNGTAKTVSYRVELNPTGINLLKDRPQGSKLYITDKLSEGLYLDLDTIELHKANRTSGSKNNQYTVALTKGSQILNPNINYNSAENSFSVEIEDPAASYIMTYDAYIGRAGVELVNSVKLEGSVIQGGSGNDSGSATAKVNAFGSAGFRLPADKFFSIQLKKVDSSRVVLPNAGQTKFGLYSSPDEGALLTSGYCDAATGICTLAVPKRELPPGDTLYWKELVAPDGYGLNDEWRTVSKDGVADVIEVVNLPTGEAAAGKIQIIKIDKETGLPLAGVKFQLFKDQDCLIPAGDVMETPASGVLVFENLYPERCYWLKEIAVPEGYLPLQTPLEVTAEKEVTLIRIENDRAPVIPAPPEDPGTPGVPGLPSGSQGSGS